MKNQTRAELHHSGDERIYAAQSEQGKNRRRFTHHIIKNPAKGIDYFLPVVKCRWKICAKKCGSSSRAPGGGNQCLRKLASILQIEQLSINTKKLRGSEENFTWVAMEVTTVILVDLRANYLVKFRASGRGL